MNRKPFKRDDLTRILTQICACAQNHSGDEEAWGPRNSVELEHQMGHVSFVVACFLSDYLDDGVDWDIVLKQLIGRVMSDAEWTDFLEKLLPQKRNRAEKAEKGWGASEKSSRYRTKSIEVNVTKFEKMGDHPKVILGLPFHDDEVGNYFEPYSGDTDPSVVSLEEGDDPFELPEDVCVPIVNVFRRGYQAVNTGRYIVEEGDHVVGVFTKHQLDRRYEPVPK
jgi:hypothetical protein